MHLSLHAFTPAYRCFTRQTPTIKAGRHERKADETPEYRRIPAAAVRLQHAAAGTRPAGICAGRPASARHAGAAARPGPRSRIRRARLATIPARHRAERSAAGQGFRRHLRPGALAAGTGKDRLQGPCATARAGRVQRLRRCAGQRAGKHGGASHGEDQLAACAAGAAIAGRADAGTAQAGAAAGRQPPRPAPSPITHRRLTMSISALSSSSAATQLSAFNRVSGSNTGSTDSVGGTRPPRQDDNGFLDAVSSALSSIGVTVPDTASSDSTGADTSTASGSDAGQALGAFLHQLMGSLHAQGGAGASAGADKDGDKDGDKGGGGGRARGHGNIKSDLQSLIQTLSSGTGSDNSSVSDLQSSFSSLITALGGSGSASASGDSSAKLSSFLQALSGSLGASSSSASLPSSGNLVNTTA